MHTSAGTYIMKTDISEVQHPDRRSQRDGHVGDLSDNRWDAQQRGPANVVTHHAALLLLNIKQDKPEAIKDANHVSFAGAALLASSISLPRARLTPADHSEQLKLGHKTVNYTQGYIITSLLLTTGDP